MTQIALSNHARAQVVELRVQTVQLSVHVAYLVADVVSGICQANVFKYGDCFFQLFSEELQLGVRVDIVHVLV